MQNTPQTHRELHSLGSRKHNVLAAVMRENPAKRYKSKPTRSLGSAKELRGYTPHTERHPSKVTKKLLPQEERQQKKTPEQIGTILKRTQTQTSAKPRDTRTIPQHLRDLYDYGQDAQ